jgi:hypothetical protein
VAVEPLEQLELVGGLSKEFGEAVEIAARILDTVDTVVCSEFDR